MSEVSGAAAGIGQSVRSVWAPVVSQQEAPVVEKVTFMSCWRREVEKGNRLIRREAEDQSQMRDVAPVTWVELPIAAPPESRYYRVSAAAAGLGGAPKPWRSG